MRVPLLLLCAWACTCLALTLSGPRESLYQQGSVTKSRYELGVDCTTSDLNVPFFFTIRDSANTTTIHNMTIICHPPTVTYTKTFGGTVYDDGILQSREVCKARDSTKYQVAFNANYTDAQVQKLIDLSNTLPGGNTVQHRQITPFSRWLKRRNAENRFTMRKLMAPNPIVFYTAKMAAGSFVSGVLGGVAGNFLADMLGFGGCDCVSQAEFNSFKNQVLAWQNATDYQLEQHSLWLKRNTQAIYDLNVRADGFDRYVANALATAESLRKGLELQASASLKFESQVQRSFSSMSDRVAAAENANIAMIAVFNTALNTLDAQSRASFYALSNATHNNTLAIRQIVSDLTKQATFMNNALYSLNKADKNIIAAVAEMNLDSKRQMVLTTGILQAIADTSISGVYRPFLKEYPSPPTDDPDAYKVTLISNQRFLYTSDLVGGGTRVLELDMYLYCSTIKVFGLPRDQADFRDFLDMMGPPGCEETDSCNCFVVYSKYQCTLNPSGRGRSYLGNVSTITNTTQSVPNLCQASPAVSTLFEDEVITNITEFERVLSVRCSEQQTNTNVTVWSGDLGSQLTGSNAGTSNCAFDFAFTLQLNASSPELIFVKNIQTSFGFVLRTIASTFRAIIGGVPQGLTYTFDPFAIRDGQEANCLTAWWMSYSPVLLPIYRLSEPVEQASITVVIDGVSTTFTDVFAASRDQFTILAERTVVGEPDSPSFVYDIPQRDLSDSPFPTSRSALYAMFPNYTCVTQTCWERYNGVPFDHIKAQFVLSPYKRTYDPFLTICTDPRRVYDGSECLIRDRNLADCPTNSSCVYTKKNARYFVSGIDVPGVEITTLVLSECPIVSVDRRPAATLATLSNQQAFPVTVRVVVEGPCPSVQNSVGIPASGATSITIPLCNNVPATRPLPSQYWSNLTVYRLVGLDYVVCNNSIRINVTGDRAEVLGTQGLVDLGIVRTQTYIIQDPVTVALTDQLLRTQVELQSLKTYVAPLYDALLLTGVPVYNDLLASIITGSANLLNATVTNVNSSRTATLTAIANLTAYSDVAGPMAEILANASAAMKRAEQNYLELKNLSFASWNSYYALANQTVVLVLANEALRNATRAFANGVISLAETLVDNGRFGFLGTIADGISWALGKAGDGIVTAAEWVGAKVKIMAEAIADVAKGIFEDMTSLFNVLTKIVPMVIGGLLAIYVIYRLYSHAQTTTAVSKGAVPYASNSNKVLEFKTLNENNNEIGQALLTLAEILKDQGNDKARDVYDSLMKMKKEKRLPYEGVEAPKVSKTELLGLNFGGFFKSSSPPAPAPSPAPVNAAHHDGDVAIELERLLGDSL